MAQRVQTDTEEAYVGKDLGSTGFVLGDELLSNFFEGLEIDASWYGDGSPYGMPVAPSMVLTSAETGFAGAGFKNTFGNLWARQEWDVHKPLLPGESYQVNASVLDVYDWRERVVVKQEVAESTLAGELVGRGRHHQSYMLNQSSGTVKLREPAPRTGLAGLRFPRVSRSNLSVAPSTLRCVESTSTETATTIPTKRRPKSWASRTWWWADA